MWLCSAQLVIDLMYFKFIVCINFASKNLKTLCQSSPPKEKTLKWNSSGPKPQQIILIFSGFEQSFLLQGIPYETCLSAAIVAKYWNMIAPDHPAYWPSHAIHPY